MGAPVAPASASATRVTAEADLATATRVTAEADPATATVDDNGNPTWVFDPSTTGGLFAFQFEDLLISPAVRMRYDSTRTTGTRLIL